MIVSNCPKLGNTINALAKDRAILPVFVKLNGVMHKANSLLTACDWLKQQGYYHPDNKDVAEFIYVS